MSEHYILPPPPYELSLQRDQKISEELQELELSKKRQTEGEEDSGEWGDNKDSKVLAQKALMELTVKPLRIQKRPAASHNAAVRGPRPLPKRPADASLCSPQGQGNRRSPLLETKARETEQDHMAETYSPAPPPFSAIAPPLVGPPYEWSMLHPNTSAAPLPLNSLLRPSFDASRQSHSNQWPTYYPPEPRTDTSFRRTSHASFQSASSSTPPRDRNFGMRLAFDPSVAYSNSQAETREMNAAALYSSAVSSHLDPGSAMNPGSRQSYIGPANRYATYARSSISISTTTSTHPSEKADISPTRSRSSFLIDPSPYPHTSKPRPGSGYEYRWATSESDITRDLYHRD